VPSLLSGRILLQLPHQILVLLHHLPHQFFRFVLHQRTLVDRDRNRQARWNNLTHLLDLSQELCVPLANLCESGLQGCNLYVG
jgi:hypothetical protein